MFWKRKKTPQPGQPVAELKHELYDLLGLYSILDRRVPSRDLTQGNILTFNPLTIFNPWPMVTHAHEQAHWRLVQSTQYGLFFRRVFLSDLPEKEGLIDLILEAQWMTQEASATYMGLISLFNEPDQLDRAISVLPVGSLGQSPYREAFDLIDTVLPIAHVRDALSANLATMFVEAAAAWALSSDILTVFPTKYRVNEQALRSYLENQAPDLRFRRLFEVLQSSGRAKPIMDFIENVIHTKSEQAGGFPDEEFWQIVDHFEEAVTQLAPSQLENRMQVMSQFNRAWDSKTEAEADQAWAEYSPEQQSLDQKKREQASKQKFEMLPDVVLGDFTILPLTPGMIDLGKKANADLGTLARGIGEDNRHERSLLLTLGLIQKSKQVMFRPTIYQSETGSPNPNSVDGALVHWTHNSGPIHLCPIKKLRKVIDTFPIEPTVVTFIGHHFVHWHTQFAKPGVPLRQDELRAIEDPIFPHSIKVCVEVNLSEAHLMMLLAGTGLAEAKQSFLIGYTEEHRVACFLDLERPGHYLLQLVSGEIGDFVFHRIAERNKFDLLQVGDGSVEIPYMPLLMFLGKALVAESAMIFSENGFIL